MFINTVLVEMNVTLVQTFMCSNINTQGLVYELMEFFLFSLLLEP